MTRVTTPLAPLVSITDNCSGLTVITLVEQDVTTCSGISSSLDVDRWLIHGFENNGGPKFVQILSKWVPQL